MGQFLLFMGRTCSPLNALAARWSCWLNKNQSVRIDDGHRIFNIDCKVILPKFNILTMAHVLCSFLSLRPNGLFPTIMQKLVFKK
jgi:hypothetical protein